MTVNVTSGTTSTNANMYSTSFAPQMANDFFGSQIFGSNSVFQYNQPRFTTAPNDLASAIVQQSVGGSGASAPLTMQDYAYATQVANMFSNQTPMLSPYTSFSQNDIFAQQLFSPMYNGQLYA